jgi:hypothetical protein
MADIADNKRNTFFSAGGAWAENERKSDHSNQSNQRRDDRADPWHGISPIGKLPTASKGAEGDDAEPHLNRKNQSKAPLRR